MKAPSDRSRLGRQKSKNYRQVEPARRGQHHWRPVPSANPGKVGAKPRDAKSKRQRRRESRKPPDVVVNPLQARLEALGKERDLKAATLNSLHGEEDKEYKLSPADELLKTQIKELEAINARMEAEIQHLRATKPIDGNIVLPAASHSAATLGYTFGEDKFEILKEFASNRGLRAANSDQPDVCLRCGIASSPFFCKDCIDTPFKTTKKVVDKYEFNNDGHSGGMPLLHAYHLNTDELKGSALANFPHLLDNCIKTDHPYTTFGRKLAYSFALRLLLSRSPAVFSDIIMAGGHKRLTRELLDWHDHAKYVFVAGTRVRYADVVNDDVEHLRWLIHYFKIRNPKLIRRLMIMNPQTEAVDAGQAYNYRNDNDGRVWFYRMRAEDYPGNVHGMLLCHALYYMSPDAISTCLTVAGGSVVSVHHPFFTDPIEGAEYSRSNGEVTFTHERGNVACHIGGHAAQSYYHSSCMWMAEASMPCRDGYLTHNVNMYDKLFYVQVASFNVTARTRLRGAVPRPGYISLPLAEYNHNTSDMLYNWLPVWLARLIAITRKPVVRHVFVRTELLTYALTRQVSTTRQMHNLNGIMMTIASAHVTPRATLTEQTAIAQRVIATRDNVTPHAVCNMPHLAAVTEIRRTPYTDMLPRMTPRAFVYSMLLALISYLYFRPLKFLVTKIVPMAWGNFDILTTTPGHVEVDAAGRAVFARFLRSGNVSQSFVDFTQTHSSERTADVAETPNYVWMIIAMELVVVGLFVWKFVVRRRLNPYAPVQWIIAALRGLITRWR